MRLPCSECITRAVCRSKSYSELMNCHYLRGTLYDHVEDRRVLSRNRKESFYINLLDLDILFGSNHYGDVVLIAPQGQKI